MNLTLLGINHRTAPLEVRERMNIDEARMGEALTDLVGREGIEEGLILSTCNRVEVVANSSENTNADMVMRQFLAAHHRCDLSVCEPHLYTLRQEEVISHMFRVASSLDSMILGEPQILGQMKQAYSVARSVGALNGPLNEILLQSFAVARRVRRETSIGTAAVSVSYAAVELAKKIFGSLEGKTIFIIGAGKMSEIAARHLLKSGASAIFVSNRTFERAVELARAFNGTAIRFDDMQDQAAKADILMVSTAAPHYVITREHVAKWLAARRNRPMFFVDIAVPRNIDPAVNDLVNAFVYDVDDLGRVVEANKKLRQHEAYWAEEIIKEEVEKTLRRVASREVVPTILAIERRLESIRQAELLRYRGRLSDLDNEHREAVEALTRGILNKILHGPIVELKTGVGQPEHGSLVQLVRKLFGVAD